MRLPEFKVEQWMTKYEGRAVYNMTDTCVQAITFADLAGDMDPGGIVLDYGAITGDEQTKTEIAKLYQKKDLDTITTAHGCLEANELVIYTLLEPGDHVIVFVPGYQQFSQLPASIGCSVSEIRCEEDKGWLPDLQAVERAVTPQTKMILLNNPNNPTGALWQGQRLRELIDLCRAHDLYLFCDEVYRDIEDQPAISDLYEKGISTASLSKSFGLAGLRYGWVKADKDIIDQINVRRDYAFVSNGPLADALAQSALKEKEKWIRRGKGLVAANKAVLKQWLQQEDRFHVQLPEAGTVCFLGYDFETDSESLALALLEEGIFFVPGSCFDEPGYLRLGLGQDPQRMKEGLQRLSRWVDAHID